MRIWAPIFTLEYFYSSVADNKDFHTQTIETDSPFLYCLLSQPDNKVNALKNWFYNSIGLLRKCMLFTFNCKKGKYFILTRYRFKINGNLV